MITESGGNLKAFCDQAEGSFHSKRGYCNDYIKLKMTHNITLRWGPAIFLIIKNIIPIFTMDDKINVYFVHFAKLMYFFE